MSLINNLLFTVILCFLSCFYLVNNVKLYSDNNEYVEVQKFMPLSGLNAQEQSKATENDQVVEWLRENVRNKRYIKVTPPHTSSPDINSEIGSRLVTKRMSISELMKILNEVDYPAELFRHRVSKVKSEEYYSWIHDEIDISPDKRNGQFEVDDPLKGLSEEERKRKLLSVCQWEKYLEPFKYKKIIQYLRGVYYKCLERSKNKTIDQVDKIHTIRHMLIKTMVNVNDKNKNSDDYAYIDQIQSMHAFIGILERTPRLEHDQLFPKYLPVNLPQKYLDFYYANVTISREGSINIFRYANDPKMKYRMINPRTVRITGEVCYELATYCDNSKANWKGKLNKLFKFKHVNWRHSIYSETEEIGALEVFYKQTGCIPYLSGMVVNPNAPYIGVYPDALTYCHGEPYMLLFKAPYEARRKPLHDIIKKLVYLSYTNGSYKIKKHDKIYGKIQLSLGVLRLNKCIFGVFGRKEEKLKMIVVHFDRDFFFKLVRNVYRVYFSKLLPRFLYNANVPPTAFVEPRLFKTINI